MAALADVCHIKPPKAEARRKIAADAPVSFVPMEDLGIDEKWLMPRQVRLLSEVVGSYTYFADGDVLLAKITPCFENGKLGIATGLANGIGFGSSEYVVFRPSEGLSREWLYYFLLREEFRVQGIARMSGAVGHKRVSREFLERCSIPIPPLPEQQRIVAILDEALERISTVKANVEKKIENAHAIFASLLQSIFTQPVSSGTERASARAAPSKHARFGKANMRRTNVKHVTRTGGRSATLRHIPGRLSLSVGMPTSGAREGWRWTVLTDLARLESGHTPSRRHPEYWGGPIPWIGIQDAREHHGRRIFDTNQSTNELGIANSSARVLPANTLCLTRTASVGYVVVMARPMATSQDFVNWVCSERLQPDFLKYLILAEGRDGLLRYASGSVHQTIYFPEAKAFCICHPDLREQLRIIKQCDSVHAETHRLVQIYECELGTVAELKKSLLHHAFAGEL